MAPSRSFSRLERMLPPYTAPRLAAIVASVLVLAACSGSTAPTAATAAPTAAAPTATKPAPATTPTPAAKEKPLTPSAAPTPRVAYLAIPLADVRTGERFTLGGFPGKVTIVQAMAVW